MVHFSNCKINIGLYITGKREDGYHNIETIFYPIPLLDVLELMDAEQIGITVIGKPIPTQPENNIVLKAWYLLKKDFPNLPPVHFYLLKNTPVGAGLGAGSANGAHALIALNKKFQLNLSTHQLLNYALLLGSDCPFFIFNKPCVATGRGEVFEEINLNLSGYKIVLVNPGILISTPWAFSQIQPKQAGISLKNVITQPVENWYLFISNDFEETVIRTHREIGTIKQKLYDVGACFALMSGSGSTMYGLFKKDTDIPLQAFDKYFVKVIEL